MIENEEEQHIATTSAQSKHASTRQLNYQHQESIDLNTNTVQGFRIPQIGPHQVNNLVSYNTSQRIQSNSKILPFVSISSNSTESNNQPIQQHPIANNVWGSNMSNVHQYSSVPEIRREQYVQSAENQKGKISIRMLLAMTYCKTIML